MKLTQTSHGVELEVHVKPKANRFEIRHNHELTMLCKEAPVKGRVNRRVEKELSRLFMRNVTIISGYRDRKKRVFIQNIRVEDVDHVLASM